MHNLRDVDVDIPRNALVAITGVSGCGKSSLAFDTLCAEGQRRYLESLSAYTRQYLNQLQRPDVDAIEGLPPTTSIDQRVGSAHPRSTLATSTEIFDYLRLLYARAGQAHCTDCGRPVSQQSPQKIVDSVLGLGERRKIMILAPLVKGRRGLHGDVFRKICKEGFVRARLDGEVVDAAEPPEVAATKAHDIDVVIDRLIVKDGIRARLQESIELALKQGEGSCFVSCQEGDDWRDRLYSSRFACPDCDVSFAELEPRTFSFNSPYGACPDCHGLGRILDDAESGECAIREEIEKPPVCPTCQGSRLGPIARAVTVAGLPLHKFTAMTVKEATVFVEELLAQLDASSKETDRTGREDAPSELDGASVLSVTPEGILAARHTVPDIATRLQFLGRVGLGYLTLDRPTRSLSGGEFQRARLAGCLGTGLTGVCYILDEPTVGLHPRDTNRLMLTLKDLRDRGNSVIVVEHDGDVIRQADHVVDLGPGAGRDGGHVVAQGTPTEVAKQENSVTGRYLAGDTNIRPLSRSRRVDLGRAITLHGACRHNLKGVTLQVPLETLTVITGVSGSGKTSLVMHTLVPLLRHALRGQGKSPGSDSARPSDRLDQCPAETLDGATLEAFHQIDRLVEINQSPIGRTGRSNPATYSGLWDEVRKVFANTREARIRGYTPRRFSFNVKQGRCDECSGQGTKRIEMRFLPDMYVTCSSCRGARFNRQTLAIRYRGKNAADVLDMRIDEAAAFFENFPRLQRILKTFSDVGLGYLCLGQSSVTLSGGEAQRVRLATELSRASSGCAVFVLDEPTTGLHAADVVRLIELLQRLVDEGHSVVVIEHQLDVIAAADWVIDLGPEGGDAGGRVVAATTPKRLAHIGSSHTGVALRGHLGG